MDVTFGKIIFAVPLDSDMCNINILFKDLANSTRILVISDQHCSCLGVLLLLIIFSVFVLNHPLAFEHFLCLPQWDFNDMVGIS